MNKTEDEIKFETNMFLDTNTGQIRFNLFDYIKELTDEQKDSLLFDNGYWAFMSEQLHEELEHGFSSNCYNSILMKFRQSFLTSDSMYEMIKEFCNDLVRSFAYEFSCAHQDMDHARKLENIVKDYFDDGRYRIGPKPTEEQVLKVCRESHETRLHGKYNFTGSFAKYFMDEFVKNNPEIQLPSSNEEEEDNV